MPTTTDVRQHVYRQGTGRVLFDVMNVIDDSIATTSLAPPISARGPQGVRLPLGTQALLADTPYPAGRADGQGDDTLGHLLLTAFGIQRREPGNRFNDHRVVASVRAKFPVHVFVLSPDGARYLDQYRHALVDLDDARRADETTVVLAGRYTDYPSFYDVLRGALADLEVGYNLRSLFVAAELFGVRASLDLGGSDAREAADLVRAAGPGVWSIAARVRLGTTVPTATQALPGVGEFDVHDRLLAGAATDASLSRTADICSPVSELPALPGRPQPGLPRLTGSPDIDWAETLWSRTAGRVPEQGNGFSAVSSTVDATGLHEMAAWAAVPAPHELLREIQSRVRVSTAVQRVTGYADGVHRSVDGDLQVVAPDPQIMRTLDREFGYHDSPDTECGLRHSNVAWVLSVDVDAMLAELGPASWALLQLVCGWMSHGLSLAAAANGYFARPARGFDEVRLRRTMHLPRTETPVFMTICGRARFTETMLDMRT